MKTFNLGDFVNVNTSDDKIVQGCREVVGVKDDSVLLEVIFPDNLVGWNMTEEKLQDYATRVNTLISDKVKLGKEYWWWPKEKVTIANPIQRVEQEIEQEIWKK